MHEISGLSQNDGQSENGQHFLQQILHHKNFDFFYLKEFMPFLNGNISIDGTFQPCKNIPGITQLFCINVQLYDHLNDRTHVQPILIAALPDKKTETYKTFFRNVEEIFKEVTGEDFLMPQKIHTDNESAILSALKFHFPESTLVTCIFHIKQNWKKFLNNLGLKIVVKF